jgi:hypothetical protein
MRLLLYNKGTVCFDTFTFVGILAWKGPVHFFETHSFLMALAF